ncbi:hypothetical protein ACH5RR_041194 [Cinchona calisaya]|uniref:NPF family transporter n=1 Tax=Cinchona calisaya TaxID=153742 RepID=A0ABD2XT57_9GENT
MMTSSPSDENQKLMEEPLMDKNLASQKGGFRPIPFILANEAFLAVSTYGLPANMILYLMRVYHLDMAVASNILFMWSAAIHFMPLVGAILADSFVGRFWMIGLGSIVNLAGLIVLCLTTIIPQARPSPCSESDNGCSSATTFQLLFLCISFGLISIGGGGVKSSSIAFGADQLKKGDDTKNVAVLERYFSWYYASWLFSVFIAYSCIVYIQDKIGWEVGFGVPVVLMFFSVISFYLASSFYVKLKPKSSLVAELIQVIVASHRKRNIKLSQSTNCLYHHKQGSFLLPTEKLRYLNRACLIIDHQQELTPDGKAKDPWSLCTVDQVEEFKTLINVIPLWSTGMFMSINISQNTFHVIQAKSMNRKIGSFEIPAGSFAMFGLVSMTLWIVLYDCLILPIASRIMGKPIRFRPKQRMGFGIIFSCLSMLVRAVIETIRRNRAIAEGNLDDPQATVNMSALWLILPYFLNGFADASITVAQNEFFYSELPRSMSSVAANLSTLGVCLANLLASFIVNIVQGLTTREGNDGWISSNINKGHYDYYFLVLVFLSLLNMIFFCICCKAYAPCKVENREVIDGQID